MTLHTLQIGMEWFTEHPGGLNRVYAHLLAQLAGLGVESEGLVVGSPAVEQLSGGLARAVGGLDAPVWQRLRSLRAMATPWLRDYGADGVIVSHFALHALSLLDYLSARPFVVHFQGPWGDESRVEGSSGLAAAARRMVERQVYDRADAAIVLSNAFGGILASRFAVPRDRIHVIPGGVDAARFSSHRSRAECREELGWPLDRPIILCVRRLVRRVGVDVLVEAAVDIRHRVPDALILIAGTGPLRDELSARISTLGLDDTVKLIGFVADEQLPAAYRAADLTVVPTVALEGFGLITVESLAAGTPCVVTPVDGLTEIMRPFAPQLIAPSIRAGDLAQTLAAVLSSEITPPDASACAEYARSRFDWPVIAAQVRRVYELARA